MQAALDRPTQKRFCYLSDSTEQHFDYIRDINMYKIHPRINSVHVYLYINDMYVCVLVEIMLSIHTFQGSLHVSVETGYLSGPVEEGAHVVAVGLVHLPQEAAALLLGSVADQTLQTSPL